MNKFGFDDYKKLLANLIEKSEKKGRGLKARIAEHLGVHTTFVTHVLNGKSHLSNEQALKISDFFLFSELETEFFVTLIQFNRAGDQRAAAFFEKKLHGIRREGYKLKEQLKKESVLSTEEQATFYSDWAFSAVRLATALPDGGSAEEIAKLLFLPRRKVDLILAFLLKAGLVKKSGGRLTYGTLSTYVGSDSPFAKKLHDNWRQRSIQNGITRDEDLMFTNVVTLAPDDFLKLRELIVSTIKTLEKVTDDAEPKVLAYLNLDWIRVT